MKKSNKRLQEWKERYEQARDDYRDEMERMDRRQKIYDGDNTIYDVEGRPTKRKATHVRNLGAEMVETQVDSNIPAPKVTAVRQEDERLAKIIEDMLRNMCDRLPLERLNDKAERVCPVLGGHGLLLDWDAGRGGKGWMGDLSVTLLGGRKLIPQAGVYEIEEMDFISVVTPMTRRQIKASYGVTVPKGDEQESEPEARSMGAVADTTGEILTVVTVFYRGDDGKIGRIRWVDGTEILLEDIVDYQARRVRHCTKCGAAAHGAAGEPCIYCGNKTFDEEVQEYEELTEDIYVGEKLLIPAMSPKRNEYGQVMVEMVQVENSPLMPQTTPAAGMALPIMRAQPQVVMEPTRIPYYKPDMFPVLLRRNVSKDGAFLGGSDMDAIKDQQNALNKVSTKLMTKVLGGGSFTTVPKGMKWSITDQDGLVIELEKASDRERIGVYNTQVDVSHDLALRGQLYEEGRQAIGITDSFQGRHDTTATSGKAKEFSAARAAGRLESKHAMKRALFADLFEAIFKFMLAYADEPRPLRGFDGEGKPEYREFNRYEFLYQDEAGNWKYNTDFLFSCDTAAPLASDRQAMWQETRMNFQQGTMGNQQELKTQLRFWRQMERLNYPMAGDMVKSLEKEQEEMTKMQQAQAQMQMQQAKMGGMVPSVNPAASLMGEAPAMGGGLV